ncbi:MAG: hypothetical protein MUE85_03775 [Microscillaceae bacterium]|jgi:hypothetical protein|nr:hypothetical protein [Microscillaceae bacterium]
MKKLSLTEMESTFGGFCGSREYREALTDAFDLGNAAYDAGNIDAFWAYYDLFWDLWSACN